MVSSSSLLAVHRCWIWRKRQPPVVRCESPWTVRQPVRAVSSPRATTTSYKSPTAQPNEPFLIANLRNQFADFPYLHCSIDQRLLTLETCCGYEYGWDWVQVTPPPFQGASRAHRTAEEVSRFATRSAQSSHKGISGPTHVLKRKENSSRSPGRRQWV